MTPNRQPLTQYQQFAARYRAGCGSDQCTNRNTRVVLARGSVPCDVLLIGEAPGESENVLGLPFIGPAGKLMDSVVRDALGAIALCDACGSVRVAASQVQGDWTCGKGHRRANGFGGRDVRVAFCNLVGCIPRDPDGDKATEPDEDQIRSCSGRLREFARIAAPRLVVKVGKLAADWVRCDPREGRFKGDVTFDADVPSCSVLHPAAVLRANVAQRGLMTQQMVVTIRNAVEEVIGC